MPASTDRMTLRTLAERLAAEGYGDRVFAGDSFIRAQDFQIERTSRLPPKWHVCVYERGQVVFSHLETTDEAAACVFWYKEVSGRMHMLHRWSSKAAAAQAEAALAAAGIRAMRNDLYDEPAFKGLIYRVWVPGRDLAAAQHVIAGRI